MIDLQDHAEGIVVPIRAHAGARRNAIRGEHDGRLQVSVTQAPEKGKANKAIVAVLATALSLRKSQFELLTGDTSAQKRFLVRGVTKADLGGRIATALAAAASNPA
jgi:uncharacterized protein